MQRARVSRQPLRLDERATFHMIELINGMQKTGHFRLERAVGSLAYAPTLFVVEEDGAGRVWPLSAVSCLHPNEPR